MLSVVVVTFNAKKMLPATLESLISQRGNDCECLFIDGASTDGTVEMLTNACRVLNQQGKRAHVLSEPDNGIYDAMNKGASLAKGDWLYFLNAGDSLRGPDMLNGLSGFLCEQSESSVVYGDIALRDDPDSGTDVVAKAGPLSELYKRMPFCHQSALVKTSLAREHPFDCRYRIAADYDFFLWAYSAGKRFKYFPETVAVFDTNGISSTNWIQMAKEYRAVQLKNNSPAAQGIVGLARYAKELLHAWMMTHGG